MQILYGTIVIIMKKAIEKVQWEAARIVAGDTKSCSRVKLLGDTGWDTMEYEKRLLLICIHHFDSDVINNMDHMCISGA